MIDLFNHTRDAWLSGPWDDEPDYFEWISFNTGLSCYISRNRHAGFWCGYVILPSHHPLYGIHLNHKHKRFKVRGGITWVNPPRHNPDSWSLGFDCDNGFQPMFNGEDPVSQYWTLWAVIRMTEELALQIYNYGSPLGT